MSKELTPLQVSKQLKDFIFELELGNVDKLFIRGSFDIIETALKAFEIIKENIELKMSVDEDVGCLYIPLDKSNICIVGYIKGKDKIDLLKEVLL